MANPEISKTATEAPANEPGVWEEPSRSWVPVLTRSDLRCMLEDVQCALRIADIVEKR